MAEIVRAMADAIASEPVNGHYWRPFEIHGSAEVGTAAIVGHNPATPIRTDELDLRNYVDCLMSDEVFMSTLYRLGKTISPTRKRLKEFSQWLRSIGWTTTWILNVHPLPFEAGYDDEIVSRAKLIIRNALRAATPKLIVVHGNEGNQLQRVLGNIDQFAHIDWVYSQYLTEFEKEIIPQCHVATFTLSDKSQGKVFATRHFSMWRHREIELLKEHVESLTNS